MFRPKKREGGNLAFVVERGSIGSSLGPEEEGEVQSEGQGLTENLVGKESDGSGDGVTPSEGRRVTSMPRGVVPPEGRRRRVIRWDKRRL